MKKSVESLASLVRSPLGPPTVRTRDVGGRGKGRIFSPPPLFAPTPPPPPLPSTHLHGPSFVIPHLTHGGDEKEEEEPHHLSSLYQAGRERKEGRARYSLGAPLPLIRREGFAQRCFCEASIFYRLSMLGECVSVNWGRERRRRGGEKGGGGKCPPVSGKRGNSRHGRRG